MRFTGMCVCVCVCVRAVGTGPAGPVLAGPLFGFAEIRSNLCTCAQRRGSTFFENKS